MWTGKRELRRRNARKKKVPWSYVHTQIDVGGVFTRGRLFCTPAINHDAGLPVVFYVVFYTFDAFFLHGRGREARKDTEGEKGRRTPTCFLFVFLFLARNNTTRA